MTTLRDGNIYQDYYELINVAQLCLKNGHINKMS